MTPLPRVLVVDNSPIVVQWVESALAGGYAVTGVAEEDNVAAIAGRVAPVAILLAPDSPAIAAGVGALQRAAPGVRVVLFADLPPGQLADERNRTGAGGFLRRAGDADAFRAALDAVVGRSAPRPFARELTSRAVVERTTDPLMGRKTIVVAAPRANVLPVDPTLSRQEFLVRKAGSGAQARAMLRTGTACLLVVGPSLADTAVEHLITEIRADPALRRTSILFIGDAVDAPAAAAATGAGANVALLRPFEERELREAVARLANVAPRRTARLLVRLRVSADADDFRVGFTRNLSASGMLLEADNGLAAGTQITLSFFVPGKTEEVSADGEVVRLHDLNAARSVVGVRFVAIGSADRSSIGTFVSARSATA